MHKQASCFSFGHCQLISYNIFKTNIFYINLHNNSEQSGTYLTAMVQGACSVTYAHEPLDKEHFWVQNTASSYHRTPGILRPQKQVPWINSSTPPLPSSVFPSVIQSFCSHKKIGGDNHMITSASDKLFELADVCQRGGLQPHNLTIHATSFHVLSAVIYMSVSHFSVVDLKSGHQFGIKNKCREWDCLMKAIACYVEGCYNLFTVVAETDHFYMHISIFYAWLLCKCCSKEQIVKTNFKR